METHNRNQMVDMLRGIGILLVIFSHAWQKAGGQNGRIFNVVVNTHMPLLFGISGYTMGIAKHLNRGKTKEEIVSFFEHQWIRLGKPFLLWNTVYFMLLEIKQKDYRNIISAKIFLNRYDPQSFGF